MIQYTPASYTWLQIIRKSCGCCDCREAKPKWAQLLFCRNFGSIALVSAVMFMTQNGARAVLLPLFAMQNFGLSAKLLGMPVLMCVCNAMHSNNVCRTLFVAGSQCMSAPALVLGRKRLCIGYLLNCSMYAWPWQHIPVASALFAHQQMLYML